MPGGAAHDRGGIAIRARGGEPWPDHEVDQAFAVALRQAAARQNTLSGDALALSEKVAQLQELINEDQREVQKLIARGR